MAMLAILEGRLATIVDDDGRGVVLDFHDDGGRRHVPFGAPTLIVDPTDAQIAAARLGQPIPRDPASELEVARFTLETLRAMRTTTTDPARLAHLDALVREAEAALRRLVR